MVINCYVSFLLMVSPVLCTVKQAKRQVMRSHILKSSQVYLHFYL